MLDAYRRSHLTQREFARQHGLSLATVTRWLRLERQVATAPRGKSAPFTELPLARVLGTTRWAAEVVRPDGWTMRLTHDTPAALVAQLLGAC